MKALSARRLQKRYGTRDVLQDISFEVEAGECVAVLGPNGAGKTTTIEILEGFRTRDGGAVSVLGHDPARPTPAWRQRIGFVLQSTSFEPELTVAETLQLYARCYRNPRNVDEVLGMVGLEDAAAARVGSLSGGQQRRLDVGVGVVGRPAFLFLDEPTTGFDPAARQQFWQLIRELRRAGTTILLTTHYLEEARQLADRVVVIQGGRVVADATPDELAGTPRSVVRLPGLRPHDASALQPVLAGGWDGDAFVVETDDITSSLEVLVRWAREAGHSLEGLTITRPTLEDSYLRLTAANGSPSVVVETAHAN